MNLLRAGWLALALLACQSEGRAPAAVTVAVPTAAPKPAAAPAPKPVVTDVAAQDYQMPPLPMARVTLTDAFKGTHVVEAEVAATGPQRTRGLMWRTELSAGKGMLFIFAAEQPLSFWMRNTLIPLDMIFIDKKLRITGIVKNAEPKTMTSRGVDAPSLYVLEVPGGWADKTGLQAGGTVRLDGIQAIEVTP